MSPVSLDASNAMPESACQSVAFTARGNECADTRLETSAKPTWKVCAIRWLKFNAVGGMGIAVQLLVLAATKTGWNVNYLFATAVAVESAVLHNFIWHERYTWADRAKASWRQSWKRLARFNLANGGVSIVGNLALMRVMVGTGHMNYMAANGVAIVLCSIANFLVSDQWVFQGSTEQHTVTPGRQS